MAENNTIEQYLTKILEAVYGKDVRQSIHDAIAQCYEDGKAGATDLTARTEITEAKAKITDIEDSVQALQEDTAYNATLYGVSEENEGIVNSQALQDLIDDVSAAGGGVIFIPAGTYAFGALADNTIGERCVKIKSNVSITGAGSNTVLKPEGQTAQGLDMFYFNDYADTGSPVYLENCRFENFVIDSENTSCVTYTSAGKGFMINLFRNCHWRNVTVKNTDGTGFGVDCPIDSSITNCTAENCGKAALPADPGGSGFGIGFGYSVDENLFLSGCLAVENHRFGFFFEHQRRFNSGMYQAANNKGFLITDCIAYHNYYNFGCQQGVGVQYKNCYSNYASYHGYYIENSNNCNIIGCYSNTETETSFVVVANDADTYTTDVTDIIIQSCISKYPSYGVRVVNNRSASAIIRCIIKDCSFSSAINKTIYTQGDILGLVLSGNFTTKNENEFTGTVGSMEDMKNSWNEESSSFNPWLGKTFAAFGTSITYLCQNYNGGYLEKIKELCGFSDYGNAGVSGAPMVNDTVNGNGINYMIKNTVMSRDLILIECCTNDFKLNVPVGLLETTNVDTFSGALKDALEHIFTNYPAKQVVIIADPQRDNDGYDVEYRNAAGCRLIDYIDMAILIGNKYGIPVCDLYRNSGINTLNLDTYTVDGLHPNAAGYELIGKCAAGVINGMTAGSMLAVPNVDKDILLGEDYYDISASAECKYKMIVLLSGTYYLYQSHMPIWIYKTGEDYHETIDITMTSRLSAADGVFGNPAWLNSDGTVELDDIFRFMSGARTIDQFICANHDVYLWGTTTKILRKSFD